MAQTAGPPVRPDIESRGEPNPPRPPARSTRSLEVPRWVRGLPPVVWAFAAFCGLALIVFRDGLGSPGQFPQGTNALNSYLTFWFVAHHPLTLWLYPFTDWGQPFPGFTGVTLLTPAALVTDPGVLVRAVEVLTWVGSSLSMYAAVRWLGGTPLAGLVAGLYFVLLGETPQYFEGHTATMISLAVAPLFLAGVYWLFLRPQLRTGLVTALLLYLLVSVGDLGMLYFLVFFAVLLAAYTIARRLLRSRYTRHELAAVVASLAFFLILIVSWLYPFLLGVRPEYTTNITATYLPFSATSGENLGYAFIGFVQENSFVHFTYHRFSYGLLDLGLLPLYFVVPVLIVAYVVATRNLDRIVLYVAACLAMIFSTGHLFPGLSGFNGWVYDHVPYFDAVPAVLRWSEITVLAYAVLLGLLLSDWERGTRPQPVRLPPTWAAGPSVSPSSSRPRRTGAWSHSLRRLARLGQSREARTVVALVIVGLTVLESFEVVAQPPGFFEYPAQYTAGFGLIGAKPLYGEIVALPFSGIYERSPWGGVTESSLFMAPYFTGGDVALFEAGTRYSLALDTIVGDGLTLGNSRNMTKFLAGVNVQYVIATRYANWSYINSFAYSPELSYYALANQTGLGAPWAVAGAQSLYQVQNFVGNVSFHSRYLVYYGPPSLVYQILDQPWYTGASDVLIDGGSIGGDAVPFAEHAAGLIATPQTLGAIPADVLAAAAAAQVPVQIVAQASGEAGSNVTEQSDPWNASGGHIATVNGSIGSLVSALSTTPLSAAGYRTVAVSARLSTPPGPAWVEAKYGAISARTNLSGAPIATTEALPYGTPGFARPGTAPNGSTNTSQSVTSYVANGTTYLDWAFQNNSTEAQSLSLNITNLTGWNGLSLDAEGNAQIPLVWTILRNSTALQVPAYETVVPIQGNLSHLSFYLPPSGYAPGAGPMTPPGAIRGMELTLPPHTAMSSVVLSNLSLYRALTTSYRSVPLGSFALASGDLLTVSAPTGTRLNSVTVSTAVVNATTPVPFESDRAPMPNPADLEFRPSSSGWGVVLLAQTFDAQWALTGAGPAPHAVGNVGLNAWLVDLTGSSVLHLRFGGDTLQSQAYVLQGGLGLTAFVMAVSVLALRRHRREAGANS